MSIDKDKGDRKLFEFGIYTLGDLAPDAVTGHEMSAKQRLREIVDAAKLADEAGIEVFGVGEHHRLDFAVSSPPVVLAAIAQVTSHIRLTSATTVLGTADPVRVFEDFATLDLLSDGRAEIISGRGAFIESFPLFGYSLDDYRELFKEKMSLLTKLNESERITWNGNMRPALNDCEIAPRPDQARLPLWVGVGGTVASAELAGEMGAGMTLAILGGDPGRFRHLVEAYRSAGKAAGHAEQSLRVAITGHCYIGDTTQQALDEFYPYYSHYYSQFMGGEQLSKAEYEKLAGPDTALFIGSAEDIAAKIIAQHKLFGHMRFMAQMDIGGMPFAKVAASIELLAKQVAPIVRRELAAGGLV